MSTEERKISLKGVLEALHSGKTRDQINTELELTKPEARVLWSHPQLKGRKTTPVVNLAIEDDLEESERLVAKETKAATEAGTEGAGASEGVGSVAGSAAPTTSEAKQPEHKAAGRAAKVPAPIVEAEAEKVEAEEVKDEADSSPWDR